MYSVILMAAFGTIPDIPDYNRRDRASASCFGQKQPAGASCHGTRPPVKVKVVVNQQSGSCYGTRSGSCHGGSGGDSVRDRRTPSRNIAAAVAENHRDRVDSRQNARTARHGGETTFFVPQSAVVVNTPQQAPVSQSHCPPVAKP